MDRSAASHPRGPHRRYSTKGFGATKTAPNLDRPLLIPVMWRPVKGHAPSGYRLHDEYPTFDAAARAVQRLRRDPSVAWAFIPDEYARFADAS